MLESLIDKKILAEHEREIYESLLQHGPQQLFELVETTTIKRTTILEYLPSMVDKGIIEVEKRGKRPLYRLSSPRMLFSMIDDKMISLSEAKKDIEGDMKQIISLYEKNTHGSSIQLLTEPEQIKARYRKIISDAHHNKHPHPLMNVSLGKHDLDELPGFKNYYSEINKMIDKYRMRSLEIITDSSENKAYKEKYHKKAHQIRLLPKTKSVKYFHYEKSIVGDNIFITYQENVKKPVAAIEIENPFLAETERLMYSFLWDNH